jgi:predicted transcriptional regulator
VVGTRSPEVSGLAGLRRGGTITELLFLYECATLEPTQLRPIAARLGLTVQAVSHSYRQLRRRGFVTVTDGRYRPTVEGVAWLHESLRRLGDDLWERIERVHVIRSTRAVALDDLAEGATVSLELRNGLLSARPGSTGESRGRAQYRARKGALVEVSDLEGIVPLPSATISVRTLAASDLTDPDLPERVRESVPTDPSALVAADGLEAYHALSTAVRRPVLRFSAGTACLEASRVGVPSYVLVLEAGLPRLLAQFAGPSPPRLEVAPLPGRGKGRRRPH